ncbi:unnamed protein product [Brassica oleracea var. botrytis]|uniref:(rape) hypothetical protein n=1 Tax=Brassica napus TaxID=3708 RepID=A0A816KE73_BRANA|nr:unnamed protein product [Brassica napus]
MSRDYVRGRGLRDVWASDATMLMRAGVQRPLVTAIRLFLQQCLPLKLFHHC